MPPDLPWERIARAGWHPLAIRILEMALWPPTNKESPGWSPKLLAAALGVPLANASYHVRKLQAAGLLAEVGELKRRGAIEHFFALVP